MSNPTDITRMTIFVVWLVAFYAIWLLLVISGGHLSTILDHLPIAGAMLAGSYVAGSTPMGGGTVGFPILVLLLDEPAALGRDFSFAVQSIGMTSATIYILCRRQPLEWNMLGPAMAGALIGTPVGVLWVAPLVSGLTIKLLFAVIWASFGILHLKRMAEITRHEGISPPDWHFDWPVGLAVGLFGSLAVASITGAGVDMLIYVALVLLRHADLRIAIATSVVLMAFVSVLGIVTKLAAGTVQPGVWENWLAAAPIVALGAPFGAMVVSRIGRRPTLLVVSVLCVGQFLWTLIHERDQLTLWSLGAALLGVAVFLAAFQLLHDVGDWRDPRGRRSSSREQ